MSIKMHYLYIHSPPKVGLKVHWGDTNDLNGVGSHSGKLGKLESKMKMGNLLKQVFYTFRNKYSKMTSESRLGRLEARTWNAEIGEWKKYLHEGYVASLGKKSHLKSACNELVREAVTGKDRTKPWGLETKVEQSV